MVTMAIRSSLPALACRVVAVNLFAGHFKVTRRCANIAVPHTTVHLPPSLVPRFTHSVSRSSSRTLLHCWQWGLPAMALRAATRLLTRRAPLLLGNREAVSAPGLLCADTIYLWGRALQDPWLGFAYTRLLRTSSWQQTALEIKIDSFGESITEGTVAEVLKERGDSVAEDTVILQIDTDKVTIDVRAPEGGVIDSILVRRQHFCWTSGCWFWPIVAFCLS